MCLIRILFHSFQCLHHISSLKYIQCRQYLLENTPNIFYIYTPCMSLYIFYIPMHVFIHITLPSPALLHPTLLGRPQEVKVVVSYTHSNIQLYLYLFLLWWSCADYGGIGLALLCPRSQLVFTFSLPSTLFVYSIGGVLFRFFSFLLSLNALL